MPPFFRSGLWQEHPLVRRSLVIIPKRGGLYWLKLRDHQARYINA